MRIYLDSCALNRLFDERDQLRIRLEAEAIEIFFRRFARKQVEWIAGEVLEEEARKNRNSTIRIETLRLLSICNERACPDESTFERAKSLELAGYGGFDALHLACAERASVDFLLTTDDRFIRRATRGFGNPRISVLNPVNWIKEFPK